MTDRSVVDEVRRRTDLLELVGQYVPLRKVGTNHVARCPFHDERTPSFSVNGDKGVYFCFGCKASGDAFRFFEQMEGVSFPEALRVLAERAGVALPETRDPERIAEDRRARDVTERLFAVCEAATQFYERSLQEGPYAELARGALEERGITQEVTERFRLGYAPARWEALAEYLKSLKLSPADAEMAGLLLPGRHGGHYDRFRHRLMFPIVDRNGKVVAFSGRILPVSEEIPEGIVPADTGKYVNSPETPVYKKGELLFGLAAARETLRKQTEAIVVEGNFDVVQMHQHGFTETVAPLGTSFTEAQAKLLRRFAETVVLVFDGDEAGRKAARASHSVCARAGLIARVGVLPPKMDPDSFLRSSEAGHGEAGMAARIRGAKGIVEWLIQDSAVPYPDTAAARIAVARLLAPTLAAVVDSVERDIYIKQTASVLMLEEGPVRSIVRTHVVQAAEVSRQVREGANEAIRRAGLTVMADDPADLSPVAIRKAQSNAVEAILLFPDLLESSDAAELMDVADDGVRPIVCEARRQWLEEGRLVAVDLIALASSEEAGSWIAARLVADIDPADSTSRERYVTALQASVRKLCRVRALKQFRVMKQASARAGTQGDPAGEEKTLNEQLRLKRELVGVRTKGGN